MRPAGDRDPFGRESAGRVARGVNRVVCLVVAEDLLSILGLPTLDPYRINGNP